MSPSFLRQASFAAAALILAATSGCGPGAASIFGGSGGETISAPAQPKVIGGEGVTRVGVVRSDSKSPKEAPVQISVAQSFYVGDVLHVKVRVAARTSMATDRLVVGIRALREGQIVETHYSRLLEQSGQALLRAGDAAVIPFELSSQDSSEYQIQCSWGEEAEALWSKVGTESALSGLPGSVASDVPSETARNSAPESRAMAPIGGETLTAPIDAPAPIRPPLSGGSGPSAAIADVSLEEKMDDCGSPPCDKRYTLSARVLNDGSVPLVHVRLAVGFSWSESAQRPKPPPKSSELQSGEELVDLGAKPLEPGQGRKLKVKIARAVPAVPGGAFLPYIRLLDWKTSS